MASHILTTSSPAPKTVTYITAFPYDQIGNHLTDGQTALYNLDALLQTVSEMAEVAMNNAEGHEKGRLKRARDLLWIAMEERKRVEQAIFESEGALLDHVERREAA